jgi:hypothetical protein
MAFHFLLSALRRAFGTGGHLSSPEASRHSSEPQEFDNDRSIDPMNPFPDPVIIEFSDVIDLHSIPPGQVRAVIEDYLEEAHERGFEWVRIIHGKGIGVQREIIRSILARTPYVMDFKDAPPEAGGWGATIVALKNSRRRGEK